MRESTKEFLRYLVNILAIILVALVIYFVIEFKNKNDTFPFKERITGIYNEFLKFINIEKANMNISTTTPSRKIPLTFIRREEALRQFNPDLFANFSEREWGKFWALIYEPIDEKQGRFNVKRFRTRQEVENILTKRYPTILEYFKESQWQEVWTAAKISWDDLGRREEDRAD
jgi:hypothetical protein